MMEATTSGSMLRNEPPALAVLESAEVTVLVDNVSDALSSTPDGITSEFRNLLEAGAQSFSGDGFCFACFGISLIVTGRIGDRTRTLLFDGGGEGRRFFLAAHAVVQSKQTIVPTVRVCFIVIASFSFGN